MVAIAGSLSDWLDEPRPQTEVISGRILRDALGHFATGVAVVTGIDARGPFGMTIQSLVSASLNPPLVTFAPSRTSSCWARLQRTRTLAINVLAHDQSHLSHHFSRPQLNKFAEISWRPSPRLSMPLLEGALMWIECGIAQVYEAGDHLIVLCDVVGLEADSSQLPLLFFKGAYGELA